MCFSFFQSNLVINPETNYLFQWRIRGIPSDERVKSEIITKVVLSPTATVEYNVVVLTLGEKAHCHVTLLDARGRPVVTNDGCSGTLVVPKPNLWWPVGMHTAPGYLYTLKARTHHFILRPVESTSLHAAIDEVASKALFLLKHEISW